MAGASIGIFLGHILPPEHLKEETRNIATVATGIIATLAALVLGLMVASAKNSFDMRADEIRESGARLIMLDRALRQYGPGAQKTRDLLRQLIEGRIRRVWGPLPPQEGAAGSQT